MYNLRSTLEGNNARTVTGSVEEIKEPKTRDSTKDQGKTSLEKKYMRTEQTKVEYNAPMKAMEKMVRKLVKKETRWRVKPPYSNIRERKNRFRLGVLLPGGVPIVLKGGF
jgi:hypothetical protein